MFVLIIKPKIFCCKRFEIVAKSRGITRMSAIGEMVCSPVSVGVIGVVAAHSLFVLLVPLLVSLQRWMCIGIEIPVSLPSWFVAVLILVLIGCMTNFIAISTSCIRSSDLTRG